MRLALPFGKTQLRLALRAFPETLLRLGAVGRLSSRQEAHEGITCVQHVFSHNDGSLSGVAARHSPYEEIVLRMRRLHPMLLAELGSSERQQTHPQLEGLLEQELIVRGPVDRFVKASVGLVVLIDVIVLGQSRGALV